MLSLLCSTRGLEKKEMTGDLHLRRVKIRLFISKMREAHYHVFYFFVLYKLKAEQRDRCVASDLGGEAHSQ